MTDFDSHDCPKRLPKSIKKELPKKHHKSCKNDSKMEPKMSPKWSQNRLKRSDRERDQGSLAPTARRRRPRVPPDPQNGANREPFGTLWALFGYQKRLKLMVFRCHFGSPNPPPKQQKNNIKNNTKNTIWKAHNKNTYRGQNKPTTIRVGMGWWGHALA